MSSVYNSQLDAFELYHKIQEDSSGLGSAADGLGLPALGHALAGSAGTAISHVVLYPLDLAITRLQVQRQLRGPAEAPSAGEEANVEYKNLRDAAEKIYKSEGGWKAFYAGCLTDTSKSIVDAFLFFLAYTFLRQRRQQKHGARSLPLLEELGVGIGAGAFSKFITTPIQQIVTRKQTAALVAARDPTSSLTPEQADKLSIKDIALQIRSERGIQGFWAGYSASLILTLNPSMTFFLQNLLKRTLLPASKRDDPGPRLVFLIAALSKVAATTITYPVSLAKARAQISASHVSPAVEKQADTSPLSTPEYLEKPDFNTPRPVYKASKYAKRGLRVLTQHLRQPAVIESLRKIYRTEGFLALYSGLEGEVLKGFLGHGFTMLLKERIHVGIINLYYLLLKATKRWPSDLGDARDRANREMGRVRTVVGSAAQDARERVGNVAETVKEGTLNATQDARDRVGNAAGTVVEGTKNAVTGDKE